MSLVINLFLFLPDSKIYEFLEQKYKAKMRDRQNTFAFRVLWKFNITSNYSMIVILAINS